MDYLMAIDLGSTSLKAVIYDLDGNCAALASRRRAVEDDIRFATQRLLEVLQHGQPDTSEDRR